MNIRKLSPRDWVSAWVALLGPLVFGYCVSLATHWGPGTVSGPIVGLVWIGVLMVLLSRLPRSQAETPEQTAVLEHAGWGEESPLAVLGAPVWTPPENLAEPAWPDLRDVMVVKAQHRARIGGAFGASLPASDVTDLPTVDLTALVEEYLATVKKAAQDALAETASTYVKARQAVRS